MKSFLKTILILSVISIKLFQRTESLKPSKRQLDPGQPTPQSLALEDVCANKYDNFKVEVVFKYGMYICLMGKLWKGSDSGVKHSTAIRVAHQSERDLSGRTPYLYSDTKVWKEIDYLNSIFKFRYAFSTDNMETVFQDQKLTEVVYMIEGENRTTAFQFDYNKIESSEEPTFDWDSDTLLMYDNFFDDWDRSQYFSFKFLLMHFPHPIKVKSVMIFDRTDDKTPKHFAIVYTEELFQGMTYYFRHHMRSERRNFTDYHGERFTTFRLNWYFDKNVDYCTQLFLPVDTAVLLRKEEYWDRPEDDKAMVTIYFAEFSENKHLLKKISFEKNTDKYTTEDDNEGQLIDNAESFLKCQQNETQTQPTLTTKPEPIICKDYPSGEKDGLDFQTIFQSIGSERGVAFYFFSGLTLIAILVLICVLIYLVVPPFKQNPKDAQNI